MDKIKIELGSIQKTLFMPVWARAIETKKENSVLTDPIAVDIINSIDYNNSNKRFVKNVNLIEYLRKNKLIIFIKLN